MRTATLSTTIVSNMSLGLSSFLLTLFSGFVFTTAAQSTLTVAAAADLAPVENELAAAFQKTRPEISVNFATEASAALSQQIENGAPYDVFLSANAQFVDHLSSFGKIRPDSVRAYAEGRLGLLWRDGKKHQIKDLAASNVRYIALPNPKLAPYGVAAQQALEHEGIWKQVQSKVVYGENVRQTLQMFESGNADAVITADSLLQAKHPDLIPVEWHQPILQKAGIVAATEHLTAAGAFLNFLTGPAAQSIFARYGFTSPRLTDEQRH
jgi:molybdate transport system substrate-binding protein